MSFDRIKDAYTKVSAFVVSTLSGIAEQAVSALVWFVVLGLGGTAMIVAGVAILFGLGWSFIAGGVFMLLGASFIRKGMING